MTEAAERYTLEEVSKPAKKDDGWGPCEEVVHGFDVTDSTQVRARVYKWRRELRYDLRVFYKRKDGTWTPTQRGLSVSASVLPDLVEAAQKLLAAAARGRHRSGVSALGLCSNKTLPFATERTDEFLATCGRSARNKRHRLLTVDGNYAVLRLASR